MLSKSSIGAGSLALMAAGGLAAAAVAAPAAAATAAPKVKVLATGLNNPRGLTWAGGKLYLAEAGTGGSDCPKGDEGEQGGPNCFGLTSSLDTISASGKVRHVLSGLLSVSDLGGMAAEGLEAVAADGKGLDLVFGESVVGTEAGIPSGSSLGPRTGKAMRATTGRLLRVHGRRSVAVDVGDADYSWAAVNQNLVPHQFPDANPNAALTVGKLTYVIDSGTNVLDSVDRAGNLRVLAFIPNNGGSDGVPTCVAQGPDKQLYIGELAPGAAKNGAKVYRYNPRTHRLKMWKSGFNVVDGCGFDAAGDFYATEFQATGFNPGPSGNPAGDIVEIAKNGKRSVLGAGKLFYPQGFAIDNKGNIYVSNWSIMTGSGAPGRPTGQVVEISR